MAIIGRMASTDLLMSRYHTDTADIRLLADTVYARSRSISTLILSDGIYHQ